jgi:hypothetical protein
MFRRFLQACSQDGDFPAIGVKRNGPLSGVTVPGISGRIHANSSGNPKLSSFAKIYRKLVFRAATFTWDIWKLADRIHGRTIAWPFSGQQGVSVVRILSLLERNPAA